MLATTCLVLAVLLIAAFAYVNLSLQPKWFPLDVARDSNGVVVGRQKRRAALAMLGLFEAFLFLAGTILLVAGCAIIGTSIGYTSF
jgi:hypothetical protein